MEVQDPYIAHLKRLAKKPLQFHAGIGATRYFSMLESVKVQVEYARLNADESANNQDMLFMQLVRFVFFLEMLRPLKSSSEEATRLFKKNFLLAGEFLEQAEKVKESIIERRNDELRLEAQGKTQSQSTGHVMGLPPPEFHPSAASAPPAFVVATDSNNISPPTQSYPSYLVHPWEHPEPPPPPTIESFGGDMPMEIRQEDRVYKMPSDLELRFKKAAWSNTQREIETCGFLVGMIRGNEIIIDAILIPPQKGTGNTCEALDEVQISTWQIENGRISIGWIHTHPTQDAFLSSIDLHMHFSYQLMQPESIALVVAPRDRFGKFHITEYGMEYLKKCNKSISGFHSHDDAIAPLFEEVSIISDDSLTLQVIDFRN